MIKIKVKNNAGDSREIYLCCTSYTKEQLFILLYPTALADSDLAPSALAALSDTPDRAGRVIGGCQLAVEEQNVTRGATRPYRCIIKWIFVVSL